MPPTIKLAYFEFTANIETITWTAKCEGAVHKLCNANSGAF